MKLEHSITVFFVYSFCFNFALNVDIQNLAESVSDYKNEDRLTQKKVDQIMQKNNEEITKLAKLFAQTGLNIEINLEEVMDEYGIENPKSDEERSDLIKKIKAEIDRINNSILSTKNNALIFFILLPQYFTAGLANRQFLCIIISIISIFFQLVNAGGTANEEAGLDTDWNNRRISIPVAGCVFRTEP